MIRKFYEVDPMICPNMLFCRRLLWRLTSPRGRKYITSVVERRDSSPRAEILRAAEKGKSYLSEWNWRRESQLQDWDVSLASRPDPQ
jgi:hypothetical protein